jgi:hypothetical protein
MELFKAPGVAETLDWTTALVALDQRELSIDIVQDTVGVILKYQDDTQLLDSEQIQALLERARVMADLKG